MYECMNNVRAYPLALLLVVWSGQIVDASVSANPCEVCFKLCNFHPLKFVRAFESNSKTCYVNDTIFFSVLTAVNFCRYIQLIKNESPWQ